MKLINDSKIRIISSLDYDEKYINDSPSDFELFSLWERVFSLAEGTNEAHSYLALLSSLGLDAPKYPRTNAEEFLRWRILQGEELYGAEPLFIADEHYIDALTIPNRKIGNTVDLSVWVSKNTINCNSFDDLVERLIKDTRDAENLYISLEINDYIPFRQRPNIYLAQKAFEKIKSGEKYNNDELIIMIELIISLCSLRRDQRGVFLLLDGNAKLDMAFDILPYLSERSLFCGRVLLHIDNDVDVDRFTSLFDSLYPKIRLYPFLYKDESPIEILAKNYPEKAIYRY